ncbi:helix-turn-helix transcriptional regulator [Avibacterium avium]|uniref:Predicted transcriptional regulator n=1 Tax=Avibacterium avium TaxID=751 RepID=A0A379ANT5_AVIAV|nr:MULTISPECIES: AlpA family phage regulatory protein [Avibacterium]MCW9715828.1 AlpA family phage regulatory protein [Avibacterium sp. 21-594]SUB23254.1 Predicted transcriptional regulator [Avibacterium avium]
MKEKKERFISLDEVITRTSLSKSTIYNYMRGGKFPKSITIASNRVVWLESEVDSWIEEKLRRRAK